VSYGFFEEVWSGYDQFLRELVSQHASKSVLDVGGGANPALPYRFVEEQGLAYSILDIAEKELEKAPAQYSRIVADIASPDLQIPSRYDLIFTKMLAEHVRNGEALHRNIFALLKPGGIAVHFFPTLYAAPFVANRLLPEWLADQVLAMVSPRDRHQHDKFPAYYSWCKGPTKKAISQFRTLGYEVMDYVGYFGHNYYQRIPLVKQVNKALTDYLLHHPLPHLTSFARVVLRRPTSA